MGSMIPDENYMSSIEFGKKLESEDIVCVLAQALAEEALGSDYKLVNKKNFIRQRYIDLAADLIMKLERHHLIITHKNEEIDEETDDKTE
jgi:hypothetical protein